MNEFQTRFHITGGLSSSGTKYINLDGAEARMSIRSSDIGPSGRGLEAAFSNHQVILTAAEKTQLIKEASAIRCYPPRVYAEHGGWIDAENYVRRDGEFTSSGHTPDVRIAFSTIRDGTSQRGTLSRWKRRVASPLSGQTLPQFLIMASFAGSVLPLTRRAHNVLFEIVGSGGEGKSTALHIAASTCGPAVDRGRSTYWFKPNGTTNWLEKRMLADADATAILDEFQTFGGGGTATARSELVYDLVMRFSEGQTRGRLGEGRPVVYRGVGLLSANQPIRELMIARHRDIVNPATSRLISQPGDAGLGLGTLDFIPSGQTNARAFVQTILAATEEEHGTAMPAFLAGLVALRSEDEAALRDRICLHMDEFVTRVVGGLGGLESRIAEAYALVYVTGRLARHLGVIPSAWNPMSIVSECYRRYVASIQFAQAKSAQETLMAYAARSDIVDLNNGMPNLTDDELNKTSGFLQPTKTGIELIVPTEAITRLFADWDERKGSAEITRFLKRDGPHLRRKRIVRMGGRKERLFVFANFGG